MRRLSLLMGLATVSTIACSSGAPSNNGNSSSSSPASARASQIVSTLRAMLPLDRSALPNVVPVGKDKWNVAGAPHMDISLPTRSTGWTRIATSDAHWIEIAPTQIADVAMTQHEGALVFADAAPSLDIVHVSLPGRLEEARLARTIDAAREQRWSLRMAPGMSARIIHDRDDWVEVLDAEGHARLRTEPAFAIDGKGERRKLQLSLTGNTLVGNLDVSGLAAPIAIDPAWTTTGSLATGRFFAGFVTLAGGKALYVGGIDNTGSPLSSAELFDVTSGTWTSAGSISEARNSFAIDVVKKGAAVVVVGGELPRGQSKAVDVYDVASGKWSVGTSLSTLTVNVWGTCGPGGPPPASTGIRNVDGVASQDGEQLVMFGGNTDLSGDPYTRVYDMTGVAPTAGTWRYYSPTGSIPKSGGWPSLENVKLQRLKDGRVFGIGGNYKFGCGGPAGLSPVGILIDAKFAGSAITAPNLELPTGRDLFAMTRIPDGRIVLTGGEVTGPDGTTKYTSESTLIFDPAAYDAGKPGWSIGPLMPEVRLGHVSGTLPDGRVIVAGGGTGIGVTVSGYSDALVYDPTASPGAWAPAGSMSSYHSIAGAGMLDAPSGAPAFMVAGGLLSYYEGVFTPSAATELFAVAAASTKCTGDGECASHHCVDGVCCDTACTGQCQACDVTGNVGKCTNVGDAPHGTRAACAGGLACDATAGSCKATCATDADCTSKGYFCDSGKCLAPLATGLPCTKNAACVSGFCADGTCCESACGDACAACDQPGLAGKCLPVKGAPHHVGVSCPGGGGTDACAQSLCDGKDTTKCAAFVGSDVSCRAASCASAQGTTAASCDGSGKCPAADTKPCSNFLQCNAKGDACLNECVSDKDCLTGYSCQKGVCSVVGDTCSVDRLTVVHKDGTNTPCAPYFCNGALCSQSCASTADCQNGSVCDGTNHCVASSSQGGGSSKSGGCSSSGSSGGEGWLLVMGAAVGVMTRRRRK